MDMFDQAKKAAAEAVENLIEQKTGQHIELDGKAEEATDADPAGATPTEALPAAFFLEAA